MAGRIDTEHRKQSARRCHAFHAAAGGIAELGFGACVAICGRFIAHLRGVRRLPRGGSAGSILAPPYSLPVGSCVNQ
jgi:hypothetical protein